MTGITSEHEGVEQRSERSKSMGSAYGALLAFCAPVCTLLPFVVLVASRAMTGRLGTLSTSVAVIAGALVTASVWFCAKRFLVTDLNQKITSWGNTQDTVISELQELALDWAIFLSAGLGLFMELSMIRWFGAMFPLFSFYKNFVLLACFAGLGLGYAITNGRSLPLLLSVPVWFFQVSILVVVRYAVPFLDRASIRATPVVEQLNMGLPVARTTPRLVAIYFLLSVVFITSALVLIPVGQACGKLMARRTPLRAYGLNLLGSLAGTVMAMGTSFLWTPPAVWFGLCLVAALTLPMNPRRGLLFGSVLSMALVCIIVLATPPGRLRVYSPYQLLELVPWNRGLLSLRAAGIYYQRVHDLSEPVVKSQSDQTLRHIADYYEFPYRAFGGAEPDVVIVGAGMGNDVAAALRCDVGHVDAVEIDPAIVKLGTLYHPEKPYDDPRVTAHINDARTYLRTTSKSYDLLVYGLLDSHTLLSPATSVRLDSYVYTVEGIREARERLKENGLMSLSFCVLSDEIGRKLHLIIKQAFGGIAPICLRADYDGSVIFMQRRDGQFSVPEQLLEETGFADVTARYANEDLHADITTDDWPFFYMPNRVFPISYLPALLLIVVLSMLLVFAFFGRRPTVSHPAFFFLGAGFMLVETKAITELGLMFGNTWHVIGIVISGILLMAYLANLFVQWKSPRSIIPAMALLIMMLGIGFWIARSGGIPSTVLGKLTAAVLLTCPMFFSGVTFSTLIHRGGDVPGALALNLLGAMVGGVLEYSAMCFGYGFLYLLAIGLYSFAVLSLIRGTGSATSVA